MTTKYFSDHPCYSLEFSQDTLESFLRREGQRTHTWGIGLDTKKTKGFISVKFKKICSPCAMGLVYSETVPQEITEIIIGSEEGMHSPPLLL